MDGPVTIGSSGTLRINLAGGGVASGSGFGQFGANPHLQPVKADNLTVGFVASPKGLPGLTITADYFDIRQTGVISFGIGSALIAQDVETRGPASPYASHLRLGSFTGAPVTAPGQVGVNLSNVFITDDAVNLAGQKLAGLDLKVEKAFALGGTGRLSVATNVAVYDHFKVRALPTEPYYEYSGAGSFGGNSSNGTIPQWRAYTTVDYSHGPIAALVGHTFIAAIDDIGTGGSTASPAVRVGAYSAVDAHVAYHFGKSRFKTHDWMKGLSFEAGAKNLFNRLPPVSPAFTQSNADISTYSPLGRVVFLEANQKF